MSAAEPTRVFLSYSWDSEEYKKWVESLATRLRQDGVDARLDVWHLKEVTVPEFMNREIRKADKVLVLCTPGMRRKVHQTEDGGDVTGTGWEMKLLTNQVFSGLGERGKGIAILTRGAWKESAPDFLIGEDYIDLSDEARFEKGYRRLLQRITGQTKQAPELGELPDNLTDTVATPLVGAVGMDAGDTPIDDANGEGSADVCLSFSLDANEEPDDGGFQVTLAIDDADGVSAAFGLDFESRHKQVAKDIRTIENNSCTQDDVMNLGAELWSLLQAGAIEDAISDARFRCRKRDGILKVRLALPPQLEAIPWEALYDTEEDANIAAAPGFSLVRTLHDQRIPPKRRAGAGPLRMLVVIPQGSGLHASSEWEKIQLALRSEGDRVILQSLDGSVTANRLADALAEGWDVVHFIGHGKLDQHGKVRLRLNREEDAEAAPEGEEGASDHWISAPNFTQMFRRNPAQLVVLNCCNAGEALSGLGGYLLKAGVPAALLMRYEIKDSVAATFSHSFYQQLVAGRGAGRVDLAVQEGRAKLNRTYPDRGRARSYVTPALYLAHGCELLFEQLAVEATAGAPAVAVAGETIDPRIPEKLVYAMQNGLCLPILGPGVLSVGASRGEEIPPGPKTLFAQLAEKSKFPGFERISGLADSEAEWLTPLLFKRICQHYVSVSKAERAGLHKAILRAYRSSTASPLLEQISRWNVTGMVYTHVDGVLENALHVTKGKNLRVLQAQDIRKKMTPADDDLVMLNLRGCYTVPTSMVLTEADEDELLESMEEIASFVLDLMNSVVGCSPLFIGVSARDPLVRFLSRRILRDDLARNRGTAYFVSEAQSEADVYYWTERLSKVEWIDLDNDTVVAGLSTAASRPAEEDEF